MSKNLTKTSKVGPKSLEEYRLDRLTPYKVKRTLTTSTSRSMAKSPRSLAKVNIAKSIKAATGEAPDPNALDPGHMRFYSYYSPSLLPGPYGIETQQVITTGSGPDNTTTIFNYKTPGVTNPPTAPTPLLQQFNVIAPRFQIDPKVVNSVYPPPGYSDEGRVLPHIVFNDPHIPWDRPLPFPTLGENLERTPEPSSTQPTQPPQVIRSVSEAGGRPQLIDNLLPAIKSASLAPTSVALDSLARTQQALPPWIALVVFDAAELKLTPAQEAALGIADSTPPAHSTLQPQTVLPSSGQVSTPGAYVWKFLIYLIFQ